MTCPVAVNQYGCHMAHSQKEVSFVILGRWEAGQQKWILMFVAVLWSLYPGLEAGSV